MYALPVKRMFYDPSGNKSNKEIVFTMNAYVCILYAEWRCLYAVIASERMP